MENKDIRNIAKQIIQTSNYIKNEDIANISGDKLSEHIIKLATLRVNIGEALALIGSKYDFAYIGRKIAYAKEFNRLGQLVDQKLTNKDKEALTHLTVGDIMNKEVELKKQADYLKILYQSSATLISTLQSRIRVLEQERKES